MDSYVALNVAYCYSHELVVYETKHNSSYLDDKEPVKKHSSAWKNITTNLV